MTIALPKDLDRRQRRTRVALHGALDRLIDRLHYADLSVSRLSDEADVGRPTFYRHFPDVSALLLDRLSGDLQEQLAVTRALSAETASPRVLLMEATVFACERIATHPALYRALLDGSAGANAVTLFREQIGNLMDIVGTRRPNGDRTEWMLRTGAVAGATSGFLLAWIEQGLTPTAREAAALLVKMSEPLMIGAA